jgi:hypothetical protein
VVRAVSSGAGKQGAVHFATQVSKTSETVY